MNEKDTRVEDNGHALNLFESDDLEERQARAALSRRLIGETSAPMRIGRYVVITQVGKGALGVVYAAYDKELDRRVAIKLVRPDRLLGEKAEEVRARLQREALALARLSHPNVVHVYDVGEFEDQIFVAMEYVEGCSLRDWLDEERTPQEVLDVFRQAGGGLAAAHAASVVHRDFKPDNVLVNERGRAFVVDFGLARSANEPEAKKPVDSVAHTRLSNEGNQLESPLTQTGALVGTPAYMAPEQFAGEPTDNRTDQFSYCVTLFEALYGVRPFPGESLEALENAVVRGQIQDTPKSGRVPAWVRRIVLRGLAVDPRARFSSMNALLAALDRDPARRRRRTLVALGTGLTLTLGAWGLVSERQRHAELCAGAESKLASVWDSRRKQAVRLAFTSTRVPYAAATFEKVSRMLDDYTRAWVHMRTDACEATHVRGEQSDELLDRRMTCLARRLTEVRAVVDVFETADDTVVQNAIYPAANLALLDRCSDSVALISEGDLPPPAQRQKIEDLRAALAKAKAMEDSGHYREGLAIAEQVMVDADRLGFAPLQAEALLRLGDLQEEWGSYDVAQKTLARAFYTGDAAGDDRTKVRAANKLIFLLSRSARVADANAWARLAQSAIRRAELGNDPDVAMFHNNLGAILYSTKNWEASIVEHRRALEIRRAIRAPDHPEIAMSLNNIGVSLEELGELDEALEHYTRSLEIIEEAFGPDHADLVYPLNGVADVQRQMGHWAEVLRARERALDIATRTKGPAHYIVAGALVEICEALIALERPGEAIAYCERALHLREAHHRLVPTIAEAQLLLARALEAAGRDSTRTIALARSARSALMAPTPEDESGGTPESFAEREALLEQANAWLANHEPGQRPQKE